MEGRDRRYSKVDEQLCKTLEHLLDSITDYCKWLPAHPAPRSPLPRFLEFVDALACFFAAVGVPRKLLDAALRVAKGFPAAERERAALAVQWRARSLQGAAALWRGMKPALRVALEGASAGGGDADAGGGRKRIKRTLD